MTEHDAVRPDPQAGGTEPPVEEAETVVDAPPAKPKASTPRQPRTPKGSKPKG